MGTSGKIGIKGIKSAGNNLTQEPGSLLSANNCVIPSKDMLANRHGQMLQSEYASGANGYIDGDASDANSNRAKEVYQWGTALLVNYTGNAGYKLDSFAAFADGPSRAAVGSYAPPEPTITRMKFAQLAKSLYWTTDAGLFTLDVVGGTARAAGLFAPRIGVSYIAGQTTGLTGDVNATGSWFAKNQAVAYRAVYGKKDANGVVKLSAASSRVVVVNPADVTVASGSLVRTSNVVTATVTAHKFVVGDKLSLDGTDGGNFNQNNNVVTSVTATTIVWAETAANHASGVQIILTSGTKSVAVSVWRGGAAFVAGDFVQVYRTDEVAGEALDPGDECFLCYERVLTATDVSAGYITITDTTPAAFLGDPLDSNDNSGDGVLGENERPPLARDLCAWDGKLWAFQTTDYHRLRVRLLGAGSPNGIQSGDLLAINTRVFSFGTDISVFTQYLPTENVLKTTYDMATFMPGGALTTLGIMSTQTFDGQTGLGEVLFTQNVLGSTFADGAGGAINAIYAATSRASAWGDALAATKAITAASTARTGGTTVTVRCTGHGFAQGQVIMLARAVTGSTDTNFPVGLKTVATVVDVDNFTYAETGSNVTLSGATAYYAYATTYKSDNNQQPARFGREGIPEAWPLVNTLSGLPDGAEVLRGAPSGSGYSLLVFLTNGAIYRVSGSYPYVVRRLDDTASLISADSLVPHAGKLHAFTTQGLCAITEAGVAIVGGDVEDITRELALQIKLVNILAVTPFGVSYESERQYMLYATYTSSTTRPIVQTLVYQSMLGQFSGADWTRTCGLVFRGPDVLVMGDGSTNRLRIERKTNVRASDSLDAMESLTANGTQTNVTTVETSTMATAPVAGDVVVFAGGARHRVTSGTTHSITTADTVSVTNGATVTLYRSYSVSFTFAPDAGGSPGIEKQWREVQLHLGVNCAGTFTLTFATEKGATGTVTNTDPDFSLASLAQKSSTLRRVAVPKNVRRCAVLAVTVTMREAFSYFDLLGVSMTSEPVSERTGK